MRFLVLGLASVLVASACGDASTGGTEGGGGPTGQGAGGGGGGATSATQATTVGSGGAGGGAAEIFCAPGLPTVSFAADVQPILTTSCAKTSCHSGSSPDAGLSLVAGEARAELVGVATSQCGGSRDRVVAGDPGASYLFDKARGVDLCGTSRRMPPSPNPKLSEGELQILEAWICAGALDD